MFRAGSNGGKEKDKKKRDKITKSKTKEHVSFIGQIPKIRSRDPDTSVFTFRFFQGFSRVRSNLTGREKIEVC